MLPAAKYGRDRGRPTSTRGPGLGAIAEVHSGHSRRNRQQRVRQQNRHDSTADPGKQSLPESATAEHRSTPVSANTPNPSAGTAATDCRHQSSSRTVQDWTEWKTRACGVMPGGIDFPARDSTGMQGWDGDVVVSLHTVAFRSAKRILAIFPPQYKTRLFSSQVQHTCLLRLPRGRSGGRWCRVCAMRVCRRWGGVACRRRERSRDSVRRCRL